MAASENRNNVTMRYASLATQWLVLLGLAVWGGLKLDARLHFRALFVILLPMAALAYSLWSLIRALNNNNQR